MQFDKIVQQVMETKTLTASVEAQINEMLWSNNFSHLEMSILEQLLEALTNGTVTHIEQSSF